MFLIALTLITIVTAPWFLLAILSRPVWPEFYLPNFGEFLNNFFSCFSFNFLFFNGDKLLKNSIPEVGVFFLWQLPFLLIGFYYLFLNSSNHKKYLIYYLVLSAIFAGFFKPSPNLIASLPFLIAVSIIISLGIRRGLLKLFSKKYSKPFLILIITLILLLVIYNSFFSYHQYFIHYLKRLA